MVFGSSSLAKTDIKPYCVIKPCLNKHSLETKILLTFLTIFLFLVCRSVFILFTPTMPCCSFNFPLYLQLPSSLASLMLISSAVSCLMETSFMADSKCICGVPHSSVREISAEWITLAFSTGAVLRLTFDGVISRGYKFNHSGWFRVSLCAYVWIWACPRSYCLNGNSGP